MAKKLKKKILNYTVIFEPAEEGGFVVYVPALPGCHTQGETLDQAYEMAQDAILGYIKTATYYLKGKKAEELDKLVKEGLEDYGKGKTKKINSLADFD